MDQASTIYAEIGNIVAGAAPQDWHEAWVTARVLDDFAEATYDYKSNSGIESWFDPGFEKNFAVVEALQKLRNLMQQSNSPKWERVIFRLRSDGKLHVDFEYSETV